LPRNPARLFVNAFQSPKAHFPRRKLPWIYADCSNPRSRQRLPPPKALILAKLPVNSTLPRNPARLFANAFQSPKAHFPRRKFPWNLK
ncbi:MAG: hypothetical protein ACI4JZ_06270, partial [Oscillospiraceae bacterium]